MVSGGVAAANGVAGSAARDQASRAFPLEAIKAYALPELSRNLLENADQRALWQDDRWSNS